MGDSMHVLIILFIFIFASCEDKVDSCSNDIVEGKASLEAGFKSINSENPSLAEFNIKLKSYLSAFEDKKCLLDGEDFHPHSEIKKLSGEIEIELSKIRNKVVYGEDDRVDQVNHPNPDLRNYANSVAAQIPNSNISSGGVLSGPTLGVSYNLCNGERFRDQKVIADCTGFLVDDDLLVTAGHCIGQSAKCNSNKKWVFGFSGSSYEVSPDDIYSCKEVVSNEWNDNEELDYALIRLDRKVEGRRPLKFRRTGLVEMNSRLAVMGHPTGLPLKIADNAMIRANNHSNYFTANLDTFGGNSGSPVLDIDTGIVEGILVRGEEDYNSIPDPNGPGFCRVTYKCENNECDGEDSTRITKVKGLEHYMLTDLEDDFKRAFSMSLKRLEHFPISVTTLKGFNYNLSGRKFLNSCISHIYERYTGKWLVASSYDCSAENFEVIRQNYLDLGQDR